MPSSVIKYFKKGQHSKSISLVLESFYWCKTCLFVPQYELPNKNAKFNRAWGAQFELIFEADCLKTVWALVIKLCLSLIESFRPVGLLFLGKVKGGEVLN